jgi:tol-pal system protein YbgF
MRNKALLIATIAMMGTLCTETHAQGLKGRWSLGAGVGAQKLFGDTGVNTDKFGFGVDGSLGYRLSNRAGLMLTAGYDQLPFTISPDPSNYATNLFFGDLKFDFELLKGSFRPYLSAGAGILNFVVKRDSTGRSLKTERFSDGAFLGGGGVRLLLGQKAMIDLGANYKHTTGDDLDAFRPGGTNDGFLTVRGGLTLVLGGPRSDGMIAMEEVPVETVQPEDVDDLRSRLDEMEGGQEGVKNGQDMEQYVKMKSKIDDLNQQIDTKEAEISTLRQSIQQKKESIGELEAAPSTAPVNVDLSQGYPKAYEAALNLYYGKRYPEAIQAFNQLLAQFPSHSLASNCQYWIGECYFGAGDNAKAVEAFNQVLSYQRSLKQDDALLMLGKAYMKLRQPANARQALDRLVKEFPNSEFVSKAEQMLSKI